LAREYLGNGTTVYPNFKLDPETSNNFNLGVFGTVDLAPRHRLYYEATGFIRKVENYIRLVITEAEGMSQYANVNNVSVKGIEGELRYDYNNSIQLVHCSFWMKRTKNRYRRSKTYITYNNRMPNRPWLLQCGIVFQKQIYRTEKRIN
jgi:outer membrane receptor protein involved in Fe transport